MKKNVMAFALVGSVFLTNAQNNASIWNSVPESKIEKTGKRDIIPNVYNTVELRLNDFKQKLAQAPLEKDVPSSQSSVIIELPIPNGTFQKFRVTESPVMDDILQASFPSIRTYNVKGIDDVYASGKLDVTEYGFHGMIISPNGNIYIDPYCKWNTKDYISYYTADFVKPIADRLPEIGVITTEENNANKTEAVTAFCAGANLKTYRIAVACTGEYARAACGTGTNTPTTAQILAKVVTTINRVDGVYETEVAVRLVLVNTTTLVLFGNPATDPFNGNDNASTLIGESQSIIGSNIGSANYDIGHTFSTGGGGLANLGCVCSNNSKASGITGSANPVGDAYDIDYVAHEVGHQFAGNHTFNGSQGSCSGNRNSSTAIEPGSGVTIMAYAGICSGDNVANNSIAYFHAKSFDEITTFVNSGGGNNCDVLTSTGNQAPVVSIGTISYSVPAGTPFTLTGSATDPDGDALTYQWEEFDLGATAGSWNMGSKPFFKSHVPTISSSQTFPDLIALQKIGGNLQTTAGEYVPTTTQTLKFRLTVRDNKMGGGGVCSATTQVNVSASAGPFAVTSQSVFPTTLPGGSTQAVNWTVNNTNLAPYNVANVNIYFSTDNGVTWTLWVANTPNDGTENVVMPTAALSTYTGRFKVESIGNVFFSMNKNGFRISAATSINQIATNSYEVKLYPNPVTSSVKIDINAVSINASEKVFLNIYNILGEKLKSEQITLTENYNKTVDFSDFSNGTYLIEVTNGTKKTVSRLVKL